MKIHPSYFILHPFLAERLIQIPENVINIFETNGQADEVRADAGRKLIFGSQLAVCRGRRMNGKTLCIADVREMAEELQVFDEFLPGFYAALDSEPKDSTGAFR